MFGTQPLEGAPMHPLRLRALAVQDARLPARARPDPVRPPRRSIIGGFPLALGSKGGKRSSAPPRIESLHAAHSRQPGSGSTPASRHRCRASDPAAPDILRPSTGSGRCSAPWPCTHARRDSGRRTASSHGGKTMGACNAAFARARDRFRASFQTASNTAGYNSQ
jgi:hypothetical protein